MPAADTPQFRRASRCSSGTCVEFAEDASTGDALLRDSADPEGPTLRFGRSEWADFVRAIKDGSINL